MAESGERVRGAPRERNREREAASLGRKIEIEADGRRPGLTKASPLTGRRHQGPGTVAGAELPDERRAVKRRTRGMEPTREQPRGDRGRQRLRRQVRLPQPEGAGGPQPTPAVDPGIRHAGPGTTTSCRAAPDDSKPKLPRRKTVALESGRRQRELHDPRLETRHRTKMPRGAASAAWGLASVE